MNTNGIVRLRDLASRKTKSLNCDCQQQPSWFCSAYSCEFVVSHVTITAEEGCHSLRRQQILWKKILAKDFFGVITGAFFESGGRKFAMNAARCQGTP
jgi:hypothetical protein